MLDSLIAEQEATPDAAVDGWTPSPEVAAAAALPAVAMAARADQAPCALIDERTAPAPSSLAPADALTADVVPPAPAHDLPPPGQR